VRLAAESEKKEKKIVNWCGPMEEEFPDCLEDKKGRLVS